MRERGIIACFIWRLGSSFLISFSGCCWWRRRSQSNGCQQDRSRLRLRLHLHLYQLHPKKLQPHQPQRINPSNPHLQPHHQNRPHPPLTIFPLQHPLPALPASLFCTLIQSTLLTARDAVLPSTSTISSHEPPPAATSSSSP